MGEPRKTDLRMRVRHALGLVPLPRQVSDEMRMGNMVVAQRVSLLVLALLLTLVVRDAFLMPHDGSLPSRLRLIAMVGMAASSALLLILSRIYLSGKSRGPHVAHFSIGQFMVSCYLFGMMVATSDVLRGGGIVMYQVFAVLGACLFVISPIISLTVMLVADVVFRVVLVTVLAGNPMVMSSLGYMYAVLAVLLIGRFTERVSNISAKVQAARISVTDELTGLSNRVALRSNFDAIHDRKITVMMCDIDDFKYFNDAYGHDLGDRVLMLYASALRRSFGTRGIYRYGGDEFLIIADDCTEDEFLDRVNHFVDILRDTQIEGTDARLTLSGGYVVGTPASDQDLRTMITLADRRLYDAKNLGKDCVLGMRVSAEDLARDAVRGVGSEAPGLFRPSFKDQLTGLANMSYFRVRAQDMIDQANKDNERGEKNTHLALAYLNLANFRSFNERYGFEAGDNLLRVTADAIRAAFPEDLVSRFAEDRFVLLAQREGIEDRIAEARHAVRDHRFEVAVELKAGIYDVAGKKVDVNEAYSFAKAACDSIKRVYNVHLRMYDDELASLAQRRQFVIDNFEAALQNGYIDVFYQPIYRASTGRLCASEALIRWEDPVRGVISPTSFVDVLEYTRFVHVLDCFVIKSVCEKWRERRAAGLASLPVSVNLSRIDFQMMDMVTMIEDEVRRADMPRQMLRIEVTESAIVENDEALDSQVARLRALGYQVWMDDFGTGTSSLADLKTHEFEVIKIDMGFLQEFDRDRTRIILVSVVDMIRRLGIQTLAEGVETPEQQEFLREAGCELLQGFGLARPMSEADFRNLLLADEEDLEPFEAHGYYDAIGRINLLAGMNLLPSSKEDEPGSATKGGSSLAIYEYDELAREATLVMANHNYEATMRLVGLDDAYDAHDFINDRLAAESSALSNFAHVVCAQGQHQPIDLIVGGDHCIMSGRVIARMQDRCAVLISFDDVSTMAGMSDDIMNGLAVSRLVTMFDRVDLVDIDSGELTNLARTKSRPIRTFEGNKMGNIEAKLPFLDYVHPDDRDRYLAFCDVHTARARLAESPTDCIQEVFRIRSLAGDYVWHEMVVSPVVLNQREFVVSCVRELSAPIVERILDPKDDITPELLWKTSLELSDRKMFWKDADRRFVGVSQSFLDYYGFESADEVLGKTDEDMGWHVDPDPFMKGEKNVLRGGAIEAARSTCVVHGQIRGIVACKRALVREGRVVGLMGYFEDAQERRPSGSQPTLNALEDKVTGLIDSAGILSILAHYEAKYRSDGTNYVLHYLDLDNLRSHNAVQGREFGDHVLHQFAHQLDLACGHECVVGHWRADEFVVVQQPHNLADVDAMLSRISAAVSRVRETDGIAMRVEYSAGTVRRDEVGEMSDLIRVAEERMRDSRTAAAMDLLDGNPFQMTYLDMVRRVDILRHYFDIVRVVNPSTCEAREVDEKGMDFGRPYCCFCTWRREGRCADCISAKTVADKQSHSKCEVLDGRVLFLFTRYVEIDDQPFSIELGMSVGETMRMTPEGADEFAGVLAREREERYLDPVTGVLDRAYFDETLAQLRAFKVAQVGIDRMERIILAYGRQAADEVAQKVALVVRDAFRGRDAVVRYASDCFVVVVEAPMSDEEFEQRLENVLAGVRRLTVDAALHLLVSVSIGAVRSDGLVRNMVNQATQAFFAAKAEGDRIIWSNDTLGGDTTSL